MKHIPVLGIIKFPDERLTRVAEPVLEEDREEAERLSLQMLSVMGQHRGFGLAAPQVAVPWRMFVMDVPGASVAPYIFVNPRLVAVSPEDIRLNEGCLSFPGVIESMVRPRDVVLEWTDVHSWTTKNAAFSFWEARCIQHEMEHLDGKLIIDHLPPVAQKKMRRRAERGAPL